MTAPSEAAILKEVSRILSARSPNQRPITPETSFGSDLEIDSVEIFDVVMELEDIFNISLPVEVASEIETVHDLVAKIGQLANARQ